MILSACLISSAEGSSGSSPDITGAISDCVYPSTRRAEKASLTDEFSSAAAENPAPASERFMFSFTILSLSSSTILIPSLDDSLEILRNS